MVIAYIIPQPTRDCSLCNTPAHPDGILSLSLVRSLHLFVLPSLLPSVFSLHPSFSPTSTPPSPDTHTHTTSWSYTTAKRQTFYDWCPSNPSLSVGNGCIHLAQYISTPLLPSSTQPVSEASHGHSVLSLHQNQHAQAVSRCPPPSSHWTVLVSSH